MKILKLLLALIGLVQLCTSYRILFAYPFEGKSHFIFVHQLLKGLAHKGHQVDIISSFPPTEKFPNITQIITLPRPKKTFVNSLSFEIAKSFNNDLSWMKSLGENMCEKLGSPEILNLAQNPPKDPPYDMLMVTVNIKC